MKLKKLTALVLSGALLLGAAGCSNSSSGSGSGGSAAPQGSSSGGGDTEPADEVCGLLKAMLISCSVQRAFLPR